MRTTLAALVFLVATAAWQPAAADSIYGDCYGKGGERCAESNHTISTSWNGQNAYPDANGRYTLEFSSSVGRTITIYCDGQSVGSVMVDGDVHFTVHCR
jgi:hypothetical protein